jgi:hypothetical protein
VNTENLIADLNREIRSYAESRRNCVARGAETPEFAALMVEKYGSGLLHGVRLVLGRNIHGDVLDEEVANIDPDWRANRDARWKRGPVGVHIPNSISVINEMEGTLKESVEHAMRIHRKVNI